MEKILFTGGASGGHFYPILAVAEEINRMAAERNLIAPELYYVGPTPYDEQALYKNNIVFKKAPAGKVRNYASPLNIFDPFKTIIGTFKAIFLLYGIFPDVVFSKGSYASVPTVLAAKFLGIPVVIHDSDTIPGKANMLAAKFAHRIGISYPQTIEYFDKKYHSKIALIGQPVRKEIAIPMRQGAHEFYGISSEVPTILVLGGSQGAKVINEIILEAAPELLEHYQIIHQTGADHEREILGMAELILEKSLYKNRYKVVGYLDDLGMKMAAGAADIIISRAGSGTIFEVAAWGKPSIVIPISEQVSRDQRKNAYAFARLGASVVVEEVNLTPHVLIAEINRIMKDPEMMQSMATAAHELYKPDAANLIAQQLLSIAMKHEE